uniref:Uncharacterized protein n=1 Tax=Equus caballus TaxID=9796 RepID=A0A9L0SKL1_HORSE
MASDLEFACIYLGLILHEDEVTVTENKINVLIKKELRSLMMTWALGFLTKPLVTHSIKS